ncbi:hypothetical protein HY622_04375 [Candidatus Uhrbacteria bacterium]|nr:hypothetical protein [Candidatus Uhrbacteria bacterium]
MQTTGYVRSRTAKDTTNQKVAMAVKAWRSYAKGKEQRSGLRAAITATFIVAAIITKGSILAYLALALLAALAWPACRAPVRSLIILAGLGTAAMVIYHQLLSG